MKRPRFADQEKILATLQPNRPRLTWLQTAVDYAVFLPLSFILGGALVLAVYAWRVIVSCPWYRGPERKPVLHTHRPMECRGDDDGPMVTAVCRDKPMECWGESEDDDE